MRRSSNENIIKEGRRMNFNNKRTRRIVSIVVLIVIIAMVATMIIPYLV
jgi:predicted nucleic acid-binding Zn ribbon protein